MPSPFPGMNPYLEQEDVWQDFHGRLLPAAAEQLGRQVDPDYIVKIEEYLFVHEAPDAPQRQATGRTDVAVTQGFTGNGLRPGTAVLETPVEVGVPVVDLESHSYLEIRDRRSRRVITAIELLSPSNKYAGRDREQYIAKRSRILGSSAHFVEIDLLRGGPRLPLTDLPPCDYYALVSRVERRPRAQLWPILLRQRLPVVPIPLTDPHPNAQLDLQGLLHHIYDAAHYERYIYDEEPTPRLSAEDAEWTRTLIPSRA